MKNSRRLLAALLAFMTFLTLYATVPLSAAESPQINLGDVNNDGEVDNLDAAVILKYDSFMRDFDLEELVAADCNGDGVVNSLDAARILKHDAGVKWVSRISIDSDAFAEAIEEFYEDDKYIYTFAVIQSYDMTVYYSDGSSEPFRRALAEGRCTISDLRICGIGFERIRKVPKIVGINVLEGDYKNEPEKFYEDKKNEYFLPTSISKGIRIMYEDGSEASLEEFIEDNENWMPMLDHFGIDYYKQVKPWAVIELSLPYSAYNGGRNDFYSDEYYNYYIDGYAAEAITVTYGNGSTEPYLDALDAGRATIEDALFANVFCRREVIKPKVMTIYVATPEMPTATAEKFYSDDKYDYYVINKSIDDFTVMYYDGFESENLKSAMENGTVKVADLAKYRIRYYKFKK